LQQLNFWLAASIVGLAASGYLVGLWQRRRWHRRITLLSASLLIASMWLMLEQAFAGHSWRFHYVGLWCFGIALGISGAILINRLRVKAT
jgi:hypothetical protein